MKCPNCGFDILDGEKFCGKCGTTVQVEAPAPAAVSTPKCKNCGAELAPDEKFCSKCGTAVQSAEPVSVLNGKSNLKCKNCGADLSAEEKFCSKCGTSVNSPVLSSFAMKARPAVSNSRRPILIAAIAAAAALIFIAVFVISCNSCVGSSPEKMLTAHAWKIKNSSSTYIYKYEQDGHFKYIYDGYYSYDDYDHYKLVDEKDNNWSVIDDELHKESSTYTYAKLKDSDLDRDYNTCGDDEWYVSDKYLVIGDDIYEAITDSEFNEAVEEVKYNEEKESEYYEDEDDDDDYYYYY